MDYGKENNVFAKKKSCVRGGGGGIIAVGTDKERGASLSFHLAVHREEEELRKRLGEKYTVDYLKMPFYRYRMHDCNKTKTKEYLETKI